MTEYPRPKIQARLVRKSDSKMMRLLAKLPFIPKAFMVQFWTTIGHTIYVPTKHDEDKDWGTLGWLEKHKVTLDHENIHIVQEERTGALIHYIKYVGPSVPLLVLTLLSLPLPALAGLSWWLPGCLGIATAVNLPLSVGLAYGRWCIEREAYMVQMDRAHTPPDAYADANWIAGTLWTNYFFTWPRSWAVKWFLTEVKKRGRFSWGEETQPL